MVTLSDITNSVRFNNLHNELTKADCIVLSFPKSGRTWLRSVLGEYFYLYYGVENTKHLNHNNHDKTFPRKQLGCPLVSFTHDYYSLERTYNQSWGQVQDLITDFLYQEHYQNKKTIILLRDPIDCMVSFYHMHYNYSVNPYVDSMYNWFTSSNFNLDYVCKWYDCLFNSLQHLKNYKLLEYNNLKQNTNDWKMLIKFVTNHCDNEKLEKSLANNSFEILQHKELETFANKGQVIKNNNKLFVRKGGQDYQLELDDDLQELIRSHQGLMTTREKIKNAQTQNS